MKAGGRVFLMLQGPHGPFFGQLADRLRGLGATVWRAGFNAGDKACWGWRRPGYLPVHAGADDWPGLCGRMMADLGVTDLVLYGTTRPIHAAAIALARSRGITVHVFEEGYLRPYWATCERDGSNGGSALMDITIEDMAARLGRPGSARPPAPAHWGDMRAHVFHGARYHFHLMIGRRRYPAYQPHRAIGVGQEFRLYLRRLLLMPLHHLQRARANRRIRGGGFPYHLILLQLEHDASFTAWSGYDSMTGFITECLTGFAAGADASMHLVFKAHPLEDGRAAIAATIRDVAERLGLSARVHYLRGGKLARLLDGASGVATVNSTAGQQALWRGIPLKAMGRAVYDKPGLVSPQPLGAFFAAPRPPDPARYATYRAFLLQTSQLPGGFYGRRNRAALLRHCIPALLSPLGPYANAGQPERHGRNSRELAEPMGGFDRGLL
jgi:capsular polysaccharide export protein